MASFHQQLKSSLLHLLQNQYGWKSCCDRGRPLWPVCPLLVCKDETRGPSHSWLGMFWEAEQLRWTLELLLEDRIWSVWWACAWQYVQVCYEQKLWLLYWTKLISLGIFGQMVQRNAWSFHTTHLSNILAKQFHPFLQEKFFLTIWILSNCNITFLSLIWNSNKENFHVKNSPTLSEAKIIESLSAG